jgi:hypothetical protein
LIVTGVVALLASFIAIALLEGEMNQILREIGNSI